MYRVNVIDEQYIIFLIHVVLDYGVGEDNLNEIIKQVL
jgi:hypothetical protein